MKKIIGKLIALALCVGVAGGLGVSMRENTPVSAETVAAYELGSVISLSDGNGSRNIATSPFEAVNLTSIAQGGDGTSYTQYVDYEFGTQSVDFTNADSFVLQVGNSLWGGVAINVMLIDGNGTCIRVINNWADVATNQAAGTCAQTFSATLGGAVTHTTYTGYGFQNIPGPYAGYMEIKMSDFEFNYDNDGLETNATFNYSNVTKVIVELDTMYNQFTKVNIGNMYVKRGSEYTQVYDVTKAEVGWGANKYGKWGEGDGNSHVVATKLEANQVVTNQYYTTNNSNWSDFYMLMPMDISAYNGISYYVDNSASTSTVYFNKFIREYQNNVTGEEWYCDAGYAMYTPDSGETFFGDANEIPAGFKGTITVPFKNFALPGWETVENGVFELDCVWWNFGFTFDVSRGTSSFIIKDFKLVGDLEEAELTSASLTLKGAIGLNFKFDLGQNWVAPDSQAKVVFKQGETVLAEEALANKTAEASGKYAFTYPVLAKDYEQDITIELQNAAGTAVVSKTYSVADYAQTIADGEYSQELKDATAALVDYCKAACDYASGEAVTAEETTLDLSAYAPTQTGNATVSNVSVKLVLDSDTELRVYFTAETLPTCTVADVEQTPVSLGNNRYYVRYTDIGAHELATPVEFAFGDYTISCSAMSYAYVVLSNSAYATEQGSLYEAMEAMYNYYAKVDAYVTSLEG